MKKKEQIINNIIREVVKSTSHEIVSSIKPVLSTTIMQALSYNVEINDYTDRYEEVQEYLMNKFPKLKRSTSTRYSTVDTTPNIMQGSYMFIDNGCLFNININRENTNRGATTRVTVHIIGKNAKKELDKIYEVMNYRDDSKILFTILGNGERYNHYINKYNMSNIFTEYNDEIIDIITKFDKDSDYYREHQLKHKLGILLYGKPGTGKTTLALAIASYLGYRLMIIKANELTKQVVNDINGCSQIVLLFEEIDCTLTSRLEDDKQVSDNKTTKSEDDLFKSMGINTLGNLLQLIDGINSPTDCIIIGTTNFKDNLDEALIRKGRFDYQFELGDINEELAIKMCKKFGVNHKIILKDKTFPINPSTLQFEILDYRRKHLIKKPN